MNPLRQLQEDAVAYLLGNPETAVVGFESFRKQAIESAVKEAIGGWTVRVPGKIGVYCLVLMPSFRVVDRNVPGVQGNVSLIVRTFEDPKINNTGLDAETVAMSNLRWFGDGLLIHGLELEIVPDDKEDALKPNYSYPGFLVYDTTLTAYMPQDYLGRTIMPTIADDNVGNVTLACTDPNAVIYYSLGGTMPQPGDNTNASGHTLVYAAPFQVPRGMIVRCLAYNPAMLPSYVDQVTVNYP